MRGEHLVARMGIRAVENFDSAFELSQECRSSLAELLSTETFCQQVRNICTTLELANVHWAACCALAEVST